MTTEAELPPIPNTRLNGPVHAWFELTYSSYQVIPRVLAQSMPVEWQARFVECLREMREAFEHVEVPQSYEVKPVRWASADSLSAHEMEDYGVTMVVHEDDRLPEYFYEGQEIEPWREVVRIPVEDPLPGYRHGYVRPAIENAPERGTKVTCVDVSTGDIDSTVITDNHLLVCDGKSYLDNQQVYKTSGTTVITIRKTL